MVFHSRFPMPPRSILTGLVTLAILFLQGADFRATPLARAEQAHRNDRHPNGDLLQLAEKEIYRYVYLRTGKLQPCPLKLRIDPALGAQEYRITSGAITGGSKLGVLYGAYRYIEHLGVRFYLHGDVVPDERLRELPVIRDEIGKPLFALRGINPWGSHAFGIDSWSADDYKAVITQLAKMRMNFIGMHCYPEGHPFAEPTVWHGLSGDFDKRGRVRTSYVSRYFNTIRSHWGAYQTKRTSDYHFGGALLFDDDVWAPEVFRGHVPLPVTAADCDDVFNRVAEQFHDAFSFARQLGVKTCLGTESPLVLPNSVAARSRDVRAVYEGTFRRIMASHPLDYYWLWTPERWMWHGNQPAEYASVVDDIHLAIEALKEVNAPFQLATCGWVLGPRNDRAALAHDLPANIPLSALSRYTGATEVDPAFGRITGREKWAIPWLESDDREGLAGVQLFAGRMRRDAADAREYGCTGLLGLHWRTEILAPNASALAQAAWDQSWNTLADWTVTGQIASYPNAAIAGTEHAPLYRTCRFNLRTIRLAVPAGKYKVVLGFCEPHFDAANHRVCDVKLEGQTVITDLDIFAKVGKFVALDYTFEDVTVSDGELTIELIARKSLPCISAIAVEGERFSSKINLGGEAYQDWQADRSRPRYLPVDDFYADWARTNFGLAEAGKIFAAIDGKVPWACTNSCPAGQLAPIATSWQATAPQFAFIDDLEQLRPRVKGAGNLVRFDYWLNTFRYVRALIEARCAMGAKQPDEVLRAWTEAYTCLLETVNSPGALAMVVNMEQNPGWGITIAKHTNQPWPKDYRGRPRLIVPNVRSVVNRGEELKLRVIALQPTGDDLGAHRADAPEGSGREVAPATGVTVHLRPLGRGEWQETRAAHIARAVYEARLPAAQGDFEFYITAGKSLVWPATAPNMNQTVVVLQ